MPMRSEKKVSAAVSQLAQAHWIAANQSRSTIRIHARARDDKLIGIGTQAREFSCGTAAPEFDQQFIRSTASTALTQAQLLYKESRGGSCSQ